MPDGDSRYVLLGAEPSKKSGVTYWTVTWGRRPATNEDEGFVAVYLDSTYQSVIVPRLRDNRTYEEIQSIP